MWAIAPRLEVGLGHAADVTTTTTAAAVTADARTTTAMTTWTTPPPTLMAMPPLDDIAGEGLRRFVLLRNALQRAVGARGAPHVGSYAGSPRSEAEAEAVDAVVVDDPFGRAQPRVSVSDYGYEDEEEEEAGERQRREVVLPEDAEPPPDDFGQARGDGGRPPATMPLRRTADTYVDERCWSSVASRAAVSTADAGVAPPWSALESEARWFDELLLELHDESLGATTYPGARSGYDDDDDDDDGGQDGDEVEDVGRARTEVLSAMTRTERASRPARPAHAWTRASAHVRGGASADAIDGRIERHDDDDDDNDDDAAAEGGSAIPPTRASLCSSSSSSSFPASSLLLSPSIDEVPALVADDSEDDDDDDEEQEDEDVEEGVDEGEGRDEDKNGPETPKHLDETEDVELVESLLPTKRPPRAAPAMPSQPPIYRSPSLSRRRGSVAPG